MHYWKLPYSTTRYLGADLLCAVFVTGLTLRVLLSSAESGRATQVSRDRRRSHA
jgi:hypothetical protein